MNIEINWYDDDESRAVLRDLALAALDRLIAQDSLALSLPLRSRRKLSHLSPTTSVNELVAYRAAEAVLQSNHHLRFTSNEEATAAINTELPAMVDGIPEFLAEVERLRQRALGSTVSNEAQMRAFSKLLENLDRVVSPTRYFNMILRNERRTLSKELTLADLDNVEPLTAESSDGEEYDRFEQRIATRPPEPGETVVAMAMLDEAVRRLTACPACETESNTCPDGVETQWWLDQARGGRPASQIIAAGRRHCSRYQGASQNDSEQLFSRYGFHATGTLMHVFARAEDRRLSDYHLLDSGQRNHGKRYRDLLSMNRRRVTPAAACCGEIEHWCGEQISRLGRGGSVDPSSFPFPGQNDEAG